MRFRSVNQLPPAAMNSSESRSEISRLGSDTQPTQPVQPVQRKRGRGNAQQFNAEDIEQLLNIVEEQLPKGNPEWETVTDRFNEYARLNFRSERSRESLKLQFNNRVKATKPEGSPNIPRDVERAKEIHGLIFRETAQVTPGDDGTLLQLQAEMMSNDNQIIRSPNASISPRSISPSISDARASALIDKVLRQDTGLKMQLKEAQSEGVILRAEIRQLQLEVARAEAKNAGGDMARAEYRELQAENRRLIGELAEAKAYIRMLERSDRKRHREEDDS